jgi:hypothetical protein
MVRRYTVRRLVVQVSPAFVTLRTVPSCRAREVGLSRAHRRHSSRFTVRTGLDVCLCAPSPTRAPSMASPPAASTSATKVEDEGKERDP